MSAFVTRFAPSPTGRLHLGHAFSALQAYDAASAAHGRFILRMEDIDRARARPRYDAAILEDLAWLGLAWETPVRRQSQHLDDYGRALAALRARGLLYRCFRTRREVLDEIGRAPQGPEQDGQVFVGAPLPPDAEADLLSRDRPYAWRLSLERARERLGDAFARLSFVEEGRGPAGDHGVIAARPSASGDVILARKDIGIAYHLAVVVDDALQGVSHVIRGQDLFQSTSVQVLLQMLLRLPTPTYRHHRLLMDAQGRRLAKRDGALSLAAMRDAGAAPGNLREQLRGYAGS